ncbi:MAG: hypothetical protein FWF43_02410 [Propionibacteriaceae bacterium]|nr:hypothetical protein [Propionibacteriaceae bacterium]
MSIHLGMVTVDTRDSYRLAHWWAEQLDGTLSAYGDNGALDPESPDSQGAFFIVTAPDGVTLGFQQVDDPTEGKNKLHLDFKCADRMAEADKLVAAGATLQYEMQWWLTLADPDGNLFCVTDLE